jgi:hypothetical protein
MSAFRRLASTTTLVALATACDSSRPDGGEPEATPQGTARAPASDRRGGERLPTLVVRGLETRTVLEVPPAEMRDALARTYRVSPDRRILGAIAEAHSLLSGRAPDTVTTTFRDGKWTVDYAGERVGELPDLPGFDDGTKLLVEWALRLIQRHPVDRGQAPASDELSRARRMLSQPKPVNILTGLESIDRSWQKVQRREWLPPAAEGLVLLTLQLPRGEVVSDPIAARALAVLTLAWASNATDSLAAVSLLRPFSLLAEHMGYVGEARALAAGLAAGDPVRLYAERDTARLRASSDPLARFLYLTELARVGGSEPWRAWHDRITARDGPHDHDDDYEEDHGQPLESGLVTSGVLGRGLEFERFRSNATIPPQMPAQLGIELRAVAAEKGRQLEHVDKWQNLLTEPLEWLGLLQYFPDLRITYALEQVATGRRRRALRQFNEDVRVASSAFDGRFVDAAVIRTYFRAQMHYAFERACLYQVEGVESVGDATIVADGFSSTRDPLWAESSRWCTQLVQELNDEAVTDELIGAIRESASISDPALTEILDAVGNHFTRDGFVELDVARAVFAHLDSRPGGLYRAGLVAWRMLDDLILMERYYDRVVELAPGEHQQLEVWYARHRSDVPALTQIASNKGIDHEIRLDALKYMLARSADTAAVVALARELVAEPECTWDTRETVVRQILEPARRFEDAARLYKEWLVKGPGSPGVDRTYAAIGLARQYQSMGRLDDAWRALPRSARNCQRTGEKCHLALGSLQRTALIALDRGDTATARQFAGYLQQYYRSVQNARMARAEIEWRMGDDAAAAQLLAAAEDEMSSDEWYDEVAPAFLRAVGSRPVDQATRAYVALISAEIEPAMLGIIPRVAWMRGWADLAAALGRELARVGTPRFTHPQVYRYIKRAHGDSAARTWIVSRWPPPQGLITAGHAYYAREFDLLWTVTQADSGGADGSFLWLMRALGELQEPNPSLERRRALLQHYRAAGQGAYDVAGRYLMGLEPEAKILALATSPKRRAEYSYYLAIKALGEGRYRDASDWLHVTVETRQARDGERKWAKDLLDDWSRTERLLPNAATDVMVSRLK